MTTRCRVTLVLILSQRTHNKQAGTCIQGTCTCAHAHAHYMHVMCMCMLHVHTRAHMWCMHMHMHMLTCYMCMCMCIVHVHRACACASCMCMCIVHVHVHVSICACTSLIGACAYVCMSLFSPTDKQRREGPDRNAPSSQLCRNQSRRDARRHKAVYVDKAVFISRRKPYQAGCISRTRSAKSVKGSLSADRTSDVILSRLHAPGLLATSQQLSNLPTFSGWHRVLGLLNETTYLPTLFHFI